MSARRMPFSNSWVISNWFEDEQAEAAAKRRRMFQATLGLILALAALVGFGVLAAIAVDRAEPSPTVQTAKP